MKGKSRIGFCWSPEYFSWESGDEEVVRGAWIPQVKCEGVSEHKRTFTLHLTVYAGASDLSSVFHGPSAGEEQKKKRQLFCVCSTTRQEERSADKSVRMIATEAFPTPYEVQSRASTGVVGTNGSLYGPTPSPRTGRMSNGISHFKSEKKIAPLPSISCRSRP